MAIFNSFLLVIVLSFSALQAKGLDEIAHLPHAQKFIAEVLKARKLNPNDFEFKIWPSDSCKFIDMAYAIDYDYITNQIKHVLYIQGNDLKRVNSIMAHQGDKYKEELSEQDLQFRRLMQFVLGHELQHYFENLPIITLSGGSYSKIKDYRKNRSFDERRQAEIEADKCASIEPNVLRAGAKYFYEVYDEEKDLFDKDSNQEQDEHPHPLERARYLLVAANAQEVINKKFNSAFSCLLEKRKEKNEQKIREERRVRSLSSDIEKIIG